MSKPYHLLVLVRLGRQVASSISFQLDDSKAQSAESALHRSNT